MEVFMKEIKAFTRLGIIEPRMVDSTNHLVAMGTEVAVVVEVDQIIAVEEIIMCQL
jgi:hypothetical protein